MPLSKMFSNKFDDLIYSSDKEDIISHYQNKNTTSPQLLATGRNRVAGHFEPKEQMGAAKGDMPNVSFLYQRMIKCN